MQPGTARGLRDDPAGGVGAVRSSSPASSGGGTAADPSPPSSPLSLWPDVIRPKGRIAAVDALRGFALGAMAAYHVVWDLHAFGLTGLDPAATTAWRWFGHAIAATFLLLSGLSLTLAERTGHTMGHHAARLAVLALAAGSVTLATWVVLPAAAVYFGILHCLVVTNAVALLLRRCPTHALVVVSLIALATPSVWPWSLGPGWVWLGLSSHVPATLDFRPVLPWLAPVLFGVAVGRSSFVERLANQPRRNPAVRIAAFTGRHSLLIYLVHQPILAGLVCLAALAAGSAPASPVAPAEAAAFVTACSSACIADGGDDTLCKSTCHCVLAASSRRRTALDDVTMRLRGAQAVLAAAVTACRAGVLRTP